MGLGDASVALCLPLVGVEPPTGSQAPSTKPWRPRTSPMPRTWSESGVCGLRNLCYALGACEA
jgi:hypothetical protein